MPNDLELARGAIWESDSIDVEIDDAASVDAATREFGHG
jgi:hypothetical protein